MTTIGPLADPPLDSRATPDGPSEDISAQAPAGGPKPPRRRVRTLLLPVLVLLGLALVLALRR